MHPHSFTQWKQHFDHLLLKISALQWDPFTSPSYSLFYSVQHLNSRSFFLSILLPTLLFYNTIFFLNKIRINIVVQLERVAKINIWRRILQKGERGSWIYKPPSWGVVYMTRDFFLQFRGDLKICWNLAHKRRDFRFSFGELSFQTGSGPPSLLPSKDIVAVVVSHRLVSTAFARNIKWQY